jgi:ABC-type transport system involved in multi-copper enzyme maturation permease subunit
MAMLGVIIQKEIQNYIHSLRFHVSAIIILLVFGIGTPGFIIMNTAEQDQYNEYLMNKAGELNNMASENLTMLAVNRTKHYFSPRHNHIISDCHEKVLPNEITYNAYNVFGFDVDPGTVNPLLRRSQKLTWSFIVKMVISFLTILFAFDSISGEKENKTLALSLSNSISRGTILFGKFVSIVSIMSIVLVTGMILSTIIILIAGNINLGSQFIFESLGFLILSIFLISCFTVFGLLTSIIAKNSNVSLLISLSLWLIFVIVIPNTALFWARNFFSIDNADIIEQRIIQEFDDLNKNAPPGSWSSSGDPFYYRHELRANLQMSRMLKEKQHRDSYYQDMMGQFENTRNITLLSPVSLFDYLVEAFLGGGYFRFRKNWEGLHSFQEQFLSYFKEIDAADVKSPHWYNPHETYSTTRKSVNYEEVPQYTEHFSPFSERLEFMRNYLIILVTYIGVVFSIGFIVFMKYDPR